jgi:hypothetical protein
MRNKRETEPGELGSEHAPMSPLEPKSWCQHCETCAEVTPHSAPHFHVVQVLSITLFAAGLWALVTGAESVLVLLWIAPALVLWLADRQRASRIRCERCRWKRKKADARVRPNPAGTHTIIDPF